MAEYSITLESSKEHVAPNKWRLDAWVSECSGFDDPGFFLMHARKTLMNKDTTPSFETFANPCTLVEYQYGEPERPHGMYRDRKASFLFASEYSANKFLTSLEERRAKLVQLMNGMFDDLEKAASTIIGPVRIKTSSTARSFIRMMAVSSDGAPFLYQGIGSKMPKFIGIDDGSDLPVGVGRMPELDILTYTTRFNLMFPLLKDDLSEWSSSH